MVCAYVWATIHSLRLVEYLLVRTHRSFNNLHFSPLHLQKRSVRTTSTFIPYFPNGFSQIYQIDELNMFVCFHYVHNIYSLVSFVLQGWVFGQAGPTLPDLRLITGATLQEASWLFTTFNIGYLLVCAFAGFSKYM